MENWNPWEGLQERQRKPEARLDWLRGLKTCDAVTLTTDGADRLKSVERVTVTRRHDGSLWVDGHPRRNVRKGARRQGAAVAPH